jgi:hypothetical protein
MSVRCSFRRSPSSRNLLIMFAGLWPALSWSICCPDANSSRRSAPAGEALRLFHAGSGVGSISQGGGSLGMAPVSARRSGRGHPSNVVSQFI